MNSFLPSSWKPRDRLSLAIIISLSVVIILIRCLTIEEPLDRDHMIYAVAAHEILAGRPLYSEIWDIKPPGIYVSYALSQVLLGYNQFSITCLGIVVAILTMYGIFRVVWIYTRSQVAALWASFFWVIVCSDMRLQANQPNCEVFINAGLVWGLAFFALAYQKNPVPEVVSQKSFTNKHIFIAGTIWAMATLFKQVALMLPLLLCAFVFIWPPAGNERRSRWQAAIVLLMPTLVLWAVTFAYFSFTGRASIFYFTLVEYGRFYAGKGPQYNSLIQNLLPSSLWVLTPLAVLTWIGILASRDKISRAWGVMAIYAVAIQLAIALPGQYFQHYYQLWLPFFCIAAGLAISEWKSRANNIFLVSSCAALSSIGLICFQWPNWKLTPVDFSIQKYSSTYFASLPSKAREASALLLTGETFYEYGFDPGFYFETKRHLPVGTLVVGLPTAPLPLWLQSRIILDLEREKPEMAIVDTQFPASPVLVYLRENYEPISVGSPLKPLRFMARRDGKLIRRLQKSERNF